MKKITKQCPMIEQELYREYFKEDTVFLDIETTGFQANYQSCYLIGCMFHRNDHYELVQYFAETEDDEQEMLSCFLDDIITCKTMITFNGDTFDLPFLKKRFEKHNMIFHNELFHSIDLFKIAKKCKNYLHLPNYKQKTIELFLQIHREDLYDGGQLISVYKAYEKDKDQKKEELLLLHNAEDVQYMLPLLKLLEYQQLKDAEIQNLTITEPNSALDELFFEAKINCDLPVAISIPLDYCFLKITGNKITGTLKGTEEDLKYFYKNSKDYDFIINENMILPKLLSQSIPKELKRKAKKEECFALQHGHFLPAINTTKESELYQNIRLFKRAFKDKEQYFLIDLNNLNEEFIADYIKQIIKSI